MDILFGSHAALEEVPASLYLHYPLCKHHCSYCDFNVFSVAEADLKHRWSGARPWIDALRKHWEPFRKLTSRSGASRPALRTLYLGGGTPSLMTTAELHELSEFLSSAFDLSALKEFTMEINPENISEEFIHTIQTIGVTRPSVGIQSFLPGQLRRLERLATAEKLLPGLKLIQNHFKTFSLDLMLGIPDQTPESLHADLKIVEQMQPPHLSIYLLTLDPQHRWFESPAMRERIAAPELCEALYLEVCRFGRAQGYEHYEVSNFCKPGHRSLHNSNYWNSRSSYWALGPGAHGYLSMAGEKRVRYENKKDLQMWGRDSQGIETLEILTADQQRMESLYLALRTQKPIPLNALNSQRLAALQSAQLVELHDGFLTLTENGWLLMEALATDLIP